MYDWLNGALQDSSRVVTANRRLSRVLGDEFARKQIDAGHKAWRTPGIVSWQDWLLQLLAGAELSRPLPTRLNSHQSRVLWERCLRRQIANPLLNIAALVRQSREAWGRLHDYNVPLKEVGAAAQGRDQRIFAAAAFEYAAMLEREGWIDEAQLTSFVTALVRERQSAPEASLTLAGFDRITPAAADLLDAVRGAGSDLNVLQPRLPGQRGTVAAYENSDAELRAAGAWARDELLANPGQVVAVVATQLQRDADRSVRLLREGFVPGWQASGDGREAVVNVSYGKRLNTYPVIAVAFHLLRWLHEDIGSHELSLLLRSTSFGDGGLGGRSRLDIELRRLPVMSWSPERYLRTFKRSEPEATTADWHERVRLISVLRESLPASQSPSQWALQIDDSLGQLNWPGTAALDSIEFQLVNRWRELLNDLARLELVVPTMSLQEALSRLQTLAAETVFQPESEGAAIQLLGPLEAAGMEFDQLRICGLSAANWPPAGRPSPLLSRQLQRDYAMPDAEPGDTLAYAQRVLMRLAGSTDRLTCSYPMTDGDAEQSPAGLLSAIADVAYDSQPDPGWYARHLVDCVRSDLIADDPVPPVTLEETVTGGAATLQRQLTEPFSAFAYGRLGIRPILAFMDGLPANIRGSLIHDALHQLYRELPSRKDIASWTGADLDQRIPGATANAFSRLESRVDDTLRSLLQLEKRRVNELLRQVVELDVQRNEFEIVDLEASLELVIEQLRLSLRIDRIDKLDSDELVILDYKTGQRRQFVNASMEPDDLQLVVYACALAAPVAGLGFVNVDSRHVDLSAAGTEFTPDFVLDGALADWRQAVIAAAHELQQGDVRLNGALPVKSSRTFGLLSRIRELLHDS
jgi:ATP-dependent helicase/nuclease subunit B